MEKRWYRIRFSQKEILSNKQAQLKKEFEMLRRRSLSSNGMALFLSREKSLDNTVVYYISLPKSFALDLSMTMSNYSITTYGEPTEFNLVLVAGDEIEQTKTRFDPIINRNLSDNI